MKKVRLRRLPLDRRDRRRRHARHPDPASTIMVIYGIMTETNIGKLFAAGVLPGILATCLLCLAVQ